ncbi:glycosyltransferase family 2 protein [Aerococcus urinae]|uniref:Glycosyltransferase family 2 protein n=1 Tax=Aerococcus urinae TaxID=1376 RepID=A0A109RDZ2_9LACT|nr:glycosyltransferase family 2 protein [Aerococcus urinae]AMB95001.1 hypothetical protein AWM73_00030 [Aerococcus urinae]MCY3033040.1 glycosyltransferase family 2 protein [Aerococcus urinae]MCY3038184.1 glycosyltransferase family 2 protein [Aerococcus urinae]MCY3045086.1 glycosyltransferase family 2 protein [Aerococcus urinae]MCY3046246.1 glycosyltransferase family 2 protein [Aerococcus urinae]
MQEFAVIIPAYKPTQDLVPYVDQLLQAGVPQVVVVNDGSPEDCQAIFDQVAERDRVDVLTHLINRGKGTALKTAFDFELKHGQDYKGFVTADADGQHTVKDVLNIGKALVDHPDVSFVLGKRDFDQDQVPFLSRLGNKTTTRLFDWLFGYWITDTQTGLRGINAKELLWLIDLPGSKFEYEMNMLIVMAKRELPYLEETIETVYEEDRTTHYHPFRDSWRIAKVLIDGKRSGEDELI